MDNKMTLNAVQQTEAAEALRDFARFDPGQQRDALAFLRGVQFGTGLAGSRNGPEGPEDGKPA